MIIQKHNDKQVKHLSNETFFHCIFQKNFEKVLQNLFEQKMKKSMKWFLICQHRRHISIIVANLGSQQLIVHIEQDVDERLDFEIEAIETV